MEPYFFGNDDQQRMQRSAHWLWQLLKNDPAFGYEGRMVSIDAPNEEQLSAIVSLARVQGATASHFVPRRRETDFTKFFNDYGLSTDRWDQMDGGASVLEACGQILAHYDPPTGYKLQEVTVETTTETLDKFNETALACGVLPPASPALTGLTRRGLAFYVVAPDGEVAACSGAVMRNHPDSAFPDASWWGMLATRGADRGKGLSMYLGALAAAKMHERYGAARFYTGVRKDNAVSRHLCKRLGLTYNGYVDLGILDPSAFDGGSYTK